MHAMSKHIMMVSSTSLSTFYFSFDDSDVEDHVDYGVPYHVRQNSHTLGRQLHRIILIEGL